jgi:hypothetical protein
MDISIIMLDNVTCAIYLVRNAWEEINQPIVSLATAPRNIIPSIQLALKYVLIIRITF